MKALAEVMIMAVDSDENNDILMKAANVILDITKQLIRKNREHHFKPLSKQHGGRYGEDTFVYQTITPFISNIFYGPKLGYKW